jgi:CTP-dependent riboflavin kinase
VLAFGQVEAVAEEALRLGVELADGDRVLAAVGEG